MCGTTGEGWRLQLQRMKVAPAPLEPLFADASRRPVGILRFNRNGTGRITGFVLDGGRVRHLKFWKETVPARATE